MITFTLCLVVLVLGYIFYGKYLSRLIGTDENRQTPAMSMADGVDYVPMSGWRAFMIQFLNIAGLGPIFGAIMGARFGTSSYLWIVFGSIFGGGVHDFLSGMMSIRHDGESLTNIVGRHLGEFVQTAFTVFSLILMILVGVVFVSQPADLLAKLTPDWLSANVWVGVIFVYYLIATMFPVDKIIGRIYPIFGALLLFMALGIMVSLFIHQPDLPEMWNGFGTKYEKSPIFPMMFISIACGAVSGFHATQSPLMSRCLTNEKYGRSVFYGAMLTEGVVALVWAAAATSFYGENGTDHTAAEIVMELSHTWLGKVGGIMAVLGVVAAPITSGDTALRSARLMVADAIHLEQKSIRRRLVISIPLFVITLAILLFSLSDKDGFAIIWRYFSWSNQTLSVFTLWTITVYLAKTGRNYMISMIPALFMSMVTSTYILVAPEGLELPYTLSLCLGAVFTLNLLYFFIRWRHHSKGKKYVE
ncbi:MAG: divalent metal cation transporter [Bacteroidaceae bacterium]|nr:divalent metal cation transporter [Bacteroidaceae bacterium]